MKKKLANWYSGKFLFYLDEIYKGVSERKAKSLTEGVESHEKTNAKFFNFTIGDFVLVSKRDSFRQHKLLIKMFGPQFITIEESKFS